MTPWGARDVELITDMAEKDYHASSGIGKGLWVTRSILRDWLESPDGCFLRHVAHVPRAQFGGNDGCSMGSLVEAIVDGDDLRHGFLFKPAGMSFATTEGKEWKAAHKKQLDGGAILVQEADVDTAKFYIERLRRHPICRYCLDEATDRQVVVRWVDEQTGLRLQVRIDLLRRGRFLADLKTGRKPPKDFIAVADEHGYDLQAALYTRAWYFAVGEALAFCFPYMQTNYPYGCAVIQLQDRITDVADIRLRRAIDGIASEQWGELQTEPLIPEPPFWWTAKRETMIGGAA